MEILHKSREIKSASRPNLWERFFLGQKRNKYSSFTLEMNVHLPVDDMEALELKILGTQLLIAELT